MQPFDCLTDNDKEVIKQWCINYANVEPQSIEKVLYLWNKNKKTLFRAFGKQLQISFPVHQKVSSTYRHNKWRNLYSPFIIYDKQDLKNYKFDPRNHIFINNLVKWLQDEWIEILPLSTLQDILGYTKYCYIETGKTSTDKIFTDGAFEKILKIPRGTKIMRAIRKMLEYYSFPYMDSFNKWRDDISVINTDKEINAELVFSINPVDFITMSDNKSGWTSCMSWIDCGAYSNGTIEMLNSNVAIVAYLRNTESFNYNDIEIPNKSWRTLVFIHKDILLVGKHYPYQSEALAKIILDKLQEILKQNLKWKYTYQNQKYKDMIRSYNNDYIREDFVRFNNGHKIFVYMNNMYHDILEDHNTDYWCCRNKVKKNLYLNLSGPATCMCCGMPINSSSTYKKYCYDCEQKYKCCGCGFISAKHAKTYTNIFEKTYYGKIKTQGTPDCIIMNYMWDNDAECCIPKSQIYRMDHMKYKMLTKERLRELDEICRSLPNTSTNWYWF